MLFKTIAPVASVYISVATPLLGLCKISLLPLLISTSPAKVAFCEESKTSAFNANVLNVISFAAER